MSGMDNNRLRNKSICFRVTQQEAQEMEARIKVSGLPKGKYLIESALHQKIVIAVGKYQSDRLGIELRRLRECLEQEKVDNVVMVVEECKTLLAQLLALMSSSERADSLTDFKMGEPR